jgi:predicted transcriptional regulator
MPRGVTASTLNVSQRREKAYDLFGRGWKNADVARDLRVTPDTVKRYRDEYDAQLVRQAAENPRLLVNVIENTVRALTELDQLRRSVWEDYESVPASSPMRAAYGKQLLSINTERSKLFGLFGVTQEYFLHVQNVQSMQNRMLEWMRTNLCAEDRDALERFIQDELSSFMDNRVTPINASVAPELVQSTSD